MANLNVTIPYDDLVKLEKDSADKASVIALLKTDFPDDTCQVKAIKSVLAFEEEVAEPEESEPTE